MKKLNTLTCVDCRKVFRDPSESERLCPDCKKARDKKPKKPKIPTKNVYQIIKELEKYNKEHGTTLTYGQYVGVVDNQK